MNNRLRDCFIYSVAVILFVAASAKLYAATGNVPALKLKDPIFPLSAKFVFYIVAGIEFSISAFLLLKTGARFLKVLLIAWLAINYLLYRIGTSWNGAPNQCDCLGNLNERLSISPQALDTSALVALIWLIVGSSVFLIIELIQKVAQKDSAKSLGAKVASRGFL